MKKLEAGDWITNAHGYMHVETINSMAGEGKRFEVRGMYYPVRHPVPVSEPTYVPRQGYIIWPSISWTYLESDMQREEVALLVISDI